MSIRAEFSDPVATMARRIAQPGTVVTWLNHWSIQHADWEALARVSCIGVDGTLLQLLLQRAGLPLGRTSADLVLPVYFREVLSPDSRIALIGAPPGVAQRAGERITGHHVQAWDGYEQLKALRTDPDELRVFSPDVVVLGLGAGLQDEVAVELSRILPQAVICTAGGWIDQYSRKEQYFPPVIHRLRLGWLWRILHEPRRLAGRYTIDAVGILVRWQGMVEKLHDMGVRPNGTSLEVAAR